MKRIALWAVAGGMATAPLAAQSLASRVGAVREGVVVIDFALRPGICGFGDEDRWGGVQHSSAGRHCAGGPVRIALRRAGNATVGAALRPGVGWHADPSETDLGTVSAAVAARYLVRLARTMDGSSGDALAAAAIADSVDISPDLLQLIRDPDATVDARKNAIFWLGQGEVPTDSLAYLYNDLHASTLRQQLVFVLSQRDENASVDKLVDIVQHDQDRNVRKTAIFWLGQSRNPKAFKFLEDMITH